MRKLRLTKNGYNKIKSNHKELKSVDLEDSIKSVPPGEWCFLQYSHHSDEIFIAFVNSMISEKFACIQILHAGKPSSLETFSAEEFIKEKIVRAFQQRLRFKGYELGCRIFYGSSDNLPGLIIDRFENACIIQINSAGVDIHREFIREFVSEMTGLKAYLLDNHKYREKESLPAFTVDTLPDLDIVENGIRYALPGEVIQKIGFYYDHRENRLQLQNLIARMTRIPEAGVDLFCYAGSWGLNAMNAGVKKIDFVDQGDFEKTVHAALEINGFRGKGLFHRIDVFKFLDQAVVDGILFDLILCDPPAFAKSLNQRSQALEGYSKLHRKVFKIASPHAICAFSSCTHYVGHEDFQNNILDAAKREGKSVQLLHCGLQGWDHPINSMDNRANYIKSYFYILE
jgi:23S rRNA (cytosine1962-C5)-methyltransferase